MSEKTDLEKEIKVPLVSSCKTAAQLVSLSFERKLTFREMVSMRLHLFMCKTCSYYQKQTRALHEIFARNVELLETDAFKDGSLTDQARQTIKDRLQQIHDEGCEGGGDENG